MPPPRYPSSSGNNAAFGGNDFIGLPSGATLIFSHPSVPKKLYIHSGANAIKWSYDLNTITTPTIGGEVTQILSCFVGPMTISGQAAGLRTDIDGSPRPKNPGYHSKDSYNPNDELKSIIDWFLTYMHSAGQNGKGSRLRDERAILFQYPERQWDFYIQVTSLDGFGYDKSVYSPEWSITAEVLNDNALNFFRGITMSSFTDQLTSKTLTSKVGFIGFAGGQADSNNKFFGQTGNSKNPFLNPTISASAADVAKRMGNNFQSLVAAWATGDFANFGFNALLDNGAKPIDVDAAYQKLFGSTYLGTMGGYTGTGSALGSFTYAGNDTLTQGANTPWISAVLQGIGAPSTVKNKNWMYSWWVNEDGGGPGSPGKGNTAMFNWLNSTVSVGGYSISAGTSQASIKAYKNEADGIQATIQTILSGDSGRGYPGIIAGLKTGDAYSQLTDQMVYDLLTWSGHRDDPLGANHPYIRNLFGRYSKETVLHGSTSTGPVSLPPGYQAAVDACKALIVSGKLVIDKSNDKQALLTNGYVKRISGVGSPPDPVPISIEIIHFLIWAGTKYPGTRASSIVGTHSQNVAGSDRQSRHWTGYGLDLGSIGGQRVDNTSSKQIVMNFMVAVQAQNSTLKVNQMICNGAGRDDADVKRLQLSGGSPTNYVTGDHIDHIHIGY